MSEQTANQAATTAALEAEIFDTANDRLKRSFGSWFWGSMVAATAMHMALMAFFPNLSASDASFSMEEFEAIELPPEIEVPPPPERISRPANPVISEAMIDDDITISPTTFEDNLPDDLPPPRADVGADVSAAPAFTPFTVRPEVRNRAAVTRALEREYPPLLRDAGIGGTVLLWIFIDESGTVRDSRVQESSGHNAFDEAARRVASVFEFSPAMNRDQRVPVWIQIPITFNTR